MWQSEKKPKQRTALHSGLTSCYSQSLCPLMGASSTPRGRYGARQALMSVSQCLPILQSVKTPSPASATPHLLSTARGQFKF